MSYGVYIRVYRRLALSHQHPYRYAKGLPSKRMSLHETQDVRHLPQPRKIVPSAHQHQINLHRLPSPFLTILEHRFPPFILSFSILFVLIVCGSYVIMLMPRRFQGFGASIHHVPTHHVAQDFSFSAVAEREMRLCILYYP